MTSVNLKEETTKIVNRYKRRDGLYQDKYNLLTPYVYLSEQEKELTIIKCFNKINLQDLYKKKMLEVGCGTGNNILLFLKLGFTSDNIYVNDLMEDRIEKAKAKLPSNTHFYQGDARLLDFPDESFDIILQSVVFTSIINQEFKTELAYKMWDLIKPGGGILWFDFIYNNPFNSDVKGVTFKEIRRLFPEANIRKWKIILAPPIGRFVTKFSPSLYHVFNFLPFLRTHLLCWIEKDKQPIQTTSCKKGFE